MPLRQFKPEYMLYISESSSLIVDPPHPITTLFQTTHNLNHQMAHRRNHQTYKPTLNHYTSLAKLKIS